ncbi:DUF4365 domain-containing protein [Paenibacillus chungangensis]|uniref:DUF4365 domain-containing protein n=1 Tax=Paenibacillus chungangensis TaxID=696535 RepID=A0ABW3HVJ3_9BACL
MPNMDWSKLNHLQLGRYAEYFAKMEFASFGLEVFSSEVDDRGVDFIVKDNQQRYCEIQVKSLRSLNYTFMQKSKFNIDNPNLYLTLLLFKQDQMPNVFLIPSTTWREPNEVFVDKDYDKPGQTSKPEYGINISRKNMDKIEEYKFKDIIKTFM